MFKGIFFTVEKIMYINIYFVPCQISGWIIFFKFSYPVSDWIVKFTFWHNPKHMSISAEDNKKVCVEACEDGPDNLISYVNLFI